MVAARPSLTAGLVRAMRAATGSLQRNKRGHFSQRHTIRGRVPRQRYPHAVESTYATALVDVVGDVRRAIAPLLAELPDLFAGARASRGDFAELERIERIGLSIAVENQVGSVRRWTDSNGTTGETLMRYAYGYIEGARGEDGEDVDVYLGPIDDPVQVFVVHQMRKGASDRAWTEHDEDKVMLGWPNASDAMAAYIEQYDDPRFYGGMTTISRSVFRAKILLAGMYGLKPNLGAPGMRTDAGETRAARAMIEQARRAMGRSLNIGRLESIAEQYAAATSESQRRELAGQAKAALSVDITTRDARIPALIDHFVNENVSLITSLGMRSLDDIERVITGGFTSGMRHEDVAKQIEERLGVSERRARLIARDQIGKLNGQVNAARQRELGITRFTWRTVHDERVREEHAALNGQVFDYDDPPSEGLPGEAINCRCSAEPVFTDILDEVASDGDTRGDVPPDEQEEEVEPETFFSGAPDDAMEEPRATTPNPGEDAAAFAARMARNEASRRSKALARAQLKLATAPTFTPVVAPTPAGPSIQQHTIASPIGPAPAAIATTVAAAPSSAPIAVAPSAPVTKAIALTPKSGETPQQFQARMARNEASRKAKAAARAAKGGVVAAPAQPAPVATTPPPGSQPIAPPAQPVVPAPTQAPPTTAKATGPKPGESPEQHAARMARNEASRVAKARARAAKAAGAAAPAPAAPAPAPVAPAAPGPTIAAPQGSAPPAKAQPTLPPDWAPPGWPGGEVPDFIRQKELARMVDSARRAELAEQRRVEAEAAAARAATKPFGLPFQDKPPPASGPQLSTPEKKSLAAAFGNVGEKPGAKLSTKGQAQIRNHLHSSLEKYSLSNRDPRTGVGAKIQMKERLGARGAHWGDGRMAIQGEVARNAGKFARDQAAGVDYAKAIKERSPESRDHAVRANDYRTHIHEQLHGYGPRGIMSNASYQGVGKMTEEAATEIAARKIVRDQIGITHDAMAGANYQWRALGRVEDEHQVGSYSKYINDTRESARTAIDELARIPMREVALRGVNWSDAYDHLETAALRFKSLDEHRDANDADGLTGLLGKSFDFDALARHAGRELTQADKDKFVETFVREMKQKAGSSRRW